jgi:hypothetical protein
MERALGRFGPAQWVFLFILLVFFCALVYFPLVPEPGAPTAALCRGGSPPLPPPSGPPGAGAGVSGDGSALLSHNPRRARELLRDATLEALNLVAAASDNRMGHTGNEREQTLQLWGLVDTHMPAAGTFCEVGANVGHSAAIFLTASSATSFLAFDCGGKPSVYEGFRLLQRVFSYASFEFVEGNSAVQVPAYAQAHPDTSCDIIHIDGAHDGPFPAADFDSLRRFANRQGTTLVVFDDCNCATEWCIAPLAVFRKAVADGHIEELPGGDSMLSVPGGQKGSCLGRLKSRKEGKVTIPTHLLDTRNGNQIPVAEKCTF